ncbi:hypothetical protein DL771_000100 [Monosporascus sp. 5C6A]|nr:hypothetical protein DL771_000100 [Monosporascus sp. 5C6A]
MNASVEQLLDVQSLFHPLNSLLSLGITAAVIISIAFVLQNLLQGNPLPEIPSVGKGRESARRKEFLSGGAQMLYAEGYQKFKNGIFRITTPRGMKGNINILYNSAELDKLPEDVLSRKTAIDELMHAEHIKLSGAPAEFHRITKAYINPSLGRLTPILSETLQEAIATELPDSSKWTPVKLNKQLLRITAMASGRVFVGPELCRDEIYIDNAINFTIDVMKAVASVALMPLWLRPILSPIVPFVRALQRRIQGEKELLQPVVLARRLAAASVGPSLKPDDLLEWFIDDQAETGIEDDMDIVHKQMVTSFAAVHTSSQTMTNMFYTLAAEPEIVAMLREEVREVLAKHDGEFTVRSLQDLKKMDSFAKETMRYYPLMAASVQRKVLKPFTLSNGQVIPAGVIIEVANKAICDDPEIYENPEVFDALRFYKIRQTKDESRENAKSELVANAANSQFVSTGPLSLWWGYGKHACPGRFFASNMIKMVTAKVLIQYELKLPDGVTKHDARRRKDNFVEEAMRCDGGLNISAGHPESHDYVRSLRVDGGHERNLDVPFVHVQLHGSRWFESSQAAQGGKKCMSAQGTMKKSYAQAFKEGHCISVSNLNFSCRVKEIEKIIKEKANDNCVCWWPPVKEGHRFEHPGWCHVQFASAALAKKAMDTLDGLKVMGRHAKIGSSIHPIAQVSISQPAHATQPTSPHAPITISLPQGAQAPTISPTDVVGNLEEKLASLALKSWQQEWRYDPRYPDRHEKAFVEHYEKLDKVYTEAAIENRFLLRTDKFGATKFHSVEYASPGENVKPRIYMQRPSAEDEDRMEFRRVELDHISELEADGWAAWEHPNPATDPANENRDPRPMERMEDVQTTDQPHKDTAKLFAEEIKIAERIGSKWRPGQLTDPSIPAQATVSYSHFRPPVEWTDAELNSVTSGGFVPKFTRPPKAGLGWGGYDAFHEWQANGRQVKQDMLQPQTWDVDPTKFAFVSVDDPSDVTNVEVEIKGTENKDWEADAPKPLWGVFEERRQKSASRGGAGGRGGARDGARRAVRLNPRGEEMSPW